MKRFKKYTFLLGFAILIFQASVFAQENKITGYWLTDCGRSQIKIYQGENGKYHGNIVWLKNKEDKNKKDKNNPNEALRNRKILGLPMIRNFSYDKNEEEWGGGKIYDPESGNYYDAYMWFEDDKNILYLKGFVAGMRFLGRTTKWKREYSNRN